MRNGFKELEEEALLHAPEPPRQTEGKVISQLGRYKAWTALVDHFVSSPIVLVTKMLDSEIGGQTPFDPKPPSRSPQEE
jgi:hypothetical protein